MMSPKYCALLVLVAALSTFSGRCLSGSDQPAIEVVRARRIEVVNASGKPCIVLSSSDTSGESSIELFTKDGEKLIDIEVGGDRSSIALLSEGFGRVVLSSSRGPRRTINEGDPLPDRASYVRRWSLTMGADGDGLELSKSDEFLGFRAFSQKFGTASEINIGDGKNSYISFSDLKSESQAAIGVAATRPSSFLSLRDADGERRLGVK